MIANRRDLCNAIKNEDRVQFTYNGEAKNNPRIVDLYCMGKLDTNTNPTDMTRFVRGWQLAGFTNSKVNSWKLFDVDLITDFKVTGKKIDKSKPNPPYSGKDGSLVLDRKCSL